MLPRQTRQVTVIKQKTSLENITKLSCSWVHLECGVRDLCIICLKTLADSMRPIELKRHLETFNPSHVNKRVISEKSW